VTNIKKIEVFFENIEEDKDSSNFTPILRAR